MSSFCATSTPRKKKCETPRSLKKTASGQTG
jgi:hypothetical protein